MRLYQSAFAFLFLTYSAFGSENTDNQKEVKRFFVYETELNWFAALLNCSSQGMSLATIQSEEEQSMIFTELERAGGSLKKWWIGGSDLHNTGDFIWFSTGEDMSFREFGSEQPDNHKLDKEMEHCVEVVQWRNYQWNDYFCSAARPFVCEQLDCFS